MNATDAGGNRVATGELGGSRGEGKRGTGVDVSAIFVRPLSRGRGQDRPGCFPIRDRFYAPARQIALLSFLVP